MKLYVLLVESFTGTYGTAMVLAGIFHSRKDAEKAAKEIHAQTDHRLNGWIHEVEADKLYSFKTTDIEFDVDAKICGVEGDIPDEAISTGWYIE